MGEYWYTTSSGKRKRTAKGLKRQYELWDGTEEGKAKRAARNILYFLFKFAVFVSD